MEKRLARAKAKTEVLEKLIEDKSRELYLAQQQAQSAYDYLDNIVRSMLSCLIVTDDCGVVQRTNRATEGHAMCNRGGATYWQSSQCRL